MPMPQAEISAKHILHIFSSLELGGAQRRFIDYLASSDADFEHTVYAMDGNYEAVKMMDGVSVLGDGRQLIVKGNTLGAIRAARRQLNSVRPQLLVTYNFGAIEWALANRFFPICPMIHIQDGFTGEEQSTEITSRRLLRRLAYRSCTAAVVPSLTLEKHVKESWKIPTDRLEFLPNGVDISRFAKSGDASLAASLGLDQNKRIIGTVAGLRPEKNVGRLIEAFSLLEDEFSDIQLVVIGDGIGKPALTMLAERVCKKDAVVFTGALSNPEQLLPFFNIFALSSDTEQMPLSVIEAMAARLPVASTDVGDITHMVADANKPYIEGKDAATLAKSLAALLNTSEVANIGDANRAKAESDYSLSDMVHRYDRLFSHASL